jgi:hypothetical protein
MSHLTHHVRVQTRIVTVSLIFSPVRVAVYVESKFEVVVRSFGKLQLSGTWLNIIEQCLPLVR